MGDGDEGDDDDDDDGHLLSQHRYSVLVPYYLLPTRVVVKVFVGLTRLNNEAEIYGPDREGNRYSKISFWGIHPHGQGRAGQGA